jgi:outer membrane protein
MKKLKVLAMAVALLLTCGAIAQSKFGYISMDNVVQLMPGSAHIDSLLNRYDLDSIQPEYASLVEQYKWNDSLYNDSLKTPPSVRSEIAKKLPGLIYQIQNWQQIREQALQDKQSRLLAPIYKDVFDAIKAVAKEKGYTHVFSREAFLVAPDGDDLIVAVAARLKLKVPTQLMPGYKPPTGPTSIK